MLILGTYGSYTQIKYPVSGGYKYAFVTTSNADKYLKVSNGNSTSNSVGVSNGTYKIVSALDNAFVWDIANASKLSEANLQLYGDNGTPAQQFNFIKQADGSYAIINVNSGMAIDCYGGYKTNGTNIWQYYSNDTDAQRWKLIDAGDGYYYLQCKCNDLVADVTGGQAYYCNNIQMYQINYTLSQRFKLVPVTASSVQMPNTSNNSVASAIVEYELSQLGIGDTNGNNNVKYNTWYWGREVKGSGYAWCMAFQAYCCNQVTGANDAIPKTASCTDAVNKFIKKGQFQYSRYYGGSYTPKAGDLVFYTSNGGRNSNHVGMIIGDPINGYLQTVEGNIQCNDGNWKVVKFTNNKKRTVSNSYVLGYATPNY